MYWQGALMSMPFAKPSARPGRKCSVLLTNAPVVAPDRCPAVRITILLHVHPGRVRDCMPTSLGEVLGPVCPAVPPAGSSQRFGHLLPAVLGPVGAYVQPCNRARQHSIYPAQVSVHFSRI